jgi:hypothetical protein
MDAMNHFKQREKIATIHSLVSQQFQKLINFQGTRELRIVPLDGIVVTTAIVHLVLNPWPAGSHAA